LPNVVDGQLLDARQKLAEDHIDRNEMLDG